MELELPTTTMDDAAPGTAVKAKAPAKEQPPSVGPKTAPGPKKIISKCEKMFLAEKAR